MDELDRLFEEQRGVATSSQILQYLTRRGFEAELKTGNLERIWQGIYCRGEPTDQLRLNGLDLCCGSAVPVCLGTAAALHGFDTEQPADFHVLSPPGSRLRSADGLVVHRRDGAPLVTIGERPATSPAWTAIEVARSLRRPRALATLDAALRSRSCLSRRWRAQLAVAVDELGGDSTSRGPRSGWRWSTTASIGTATLTRCAAIAGATPPSWTLDGS